MRAFLACVNFFLAHHVRGPILLASIVLFSVGVSAVPAVGVPGSAHALRSMTGFSLGIAFMVLLAVAVVLPLVSARWTTRRRMGSARGRIFLNFSSLAAHGGLLLMLGLGLVPVTRALLSLRHPRPAPGARPVICRRVLDRAGGFEVGAGGAETHLLRLELPQDVRGGREVLLRLHPSVILVRDRAGPPAGLVFPLEVAWRPAGRGTWKAASPLVFTRHRAEQLRLMLPSPLPSRELQVRLRQAQLGYRLRFEEDAVVLLGGRVPLVPALLNGLLCLGLDAVALMALCLWFSRFVSFPIAVGAALTAAVTGAFLDWPLAPGSTLVDPPGLIAAGLAPDLGDVGATLAKALGWVVFAGLLAFVDPRLEGGT